MTIATLPALQIITNEGKAIVQSGSYDLLIRMGNNLKKSGDILSYSLFSPEGVLLLLDTSTCPICENTK